MNLEDYRILVTGGAGFIGSHLVQNLLKAGCNVTVYDNFDAFYPGKEENARELLRFGKDSVTIVRGDILDVPSISSAVKEADLVFHLAGQAGVRYCNEAPLKANQVNVDGTLNVLMAARKHSIKKLVYASSSSIFGDPLYLPIDEKHPTNPNSPYGVSKLAGEHYCRVFSRIYGMNLTCLRYFSVYGPRGRPDQVIYAFADRIANRKQPVIYGSGEQTRDFTYVSDVVDATVLAMENERANGEVFNIGHGSRITINQLVEKVISGMRMEGKIEPIHEAVSKGDFPDTEAENAKARQLLGWNPHVTVEEGLDLFFDWFLSPSVSDSIGLKNKISG